MKTELLEFTDKVVSVVNIPMSITEQDIEGIIVSAFEGGSNYWMDIDSSQDCPNNVPLSVWATKMILGGKPFSVVEMDEEKSHDITLEKLLKGIVMNSQKRPFDSDKEKWDNDSADCILQYALFGEAIYG